MKVENFIQRDVNAAEQEQWCKGSKDSAQKWTDLGFARLARLDLGKKRFYKHFSKF